MHKLYQQLVDKLKHTQDPIECENIRQRLHWLRSEYDIEPKSAKRPKKNYTRNKPKR